MIPHPEMGRCPAIPLHCGCREWSQVLRDTETEPTARTRKMRQQEKQASIVQLYRDLRSEYNEPREILCDYLTGSDTSTICRRKGHCVMSMRKSAVQRATESCTIATRMEGKQESLPGRETRNEGKEERERVRKGGLLGLCTFPCDGWMGRDGAWKCACQS